MSGQRNVKHVHGVLPMNRALVLLSPLLLTLLCSCSSLPASGGISLNSWREDPGRMRMPLWLEEGLAESLAIDISKREGLAHYSPLTDVPPSGLDALCVELLRKAPSDRILAGIGGRGKLPELFGPERAAYAPAFYTASTSFVRYISARHGYAPLLQAIAAFDKEMEVLERRTGAPLAQTKA